MPSSCGAERSEGKRRVEARIQGEDERGCAERMLKRDSKPLTRAIQEARRGGSQVDGETDDKEVCRNSRRKN